MAVLPCTGRRRGPALDLYRYTWCTTVATKGNAYFSLFITLLLPPFFVQRLVRFFLRRRSSGALSFLALFSLYYSSVLCFPIGLGVV